ncbi:hypothetical protein DIPPA_17196 [Diplonema papillatum]|nr:hypothetical protein DIPPA_17196 [Diplonema papillatum]
MHCRRWSRRTGPSTTQPPRGERPTSGFSEKRPSSSAACWPRAAILPAHAACRRQLCVAELEHRRAVAAAKAAESRAMVAPAVRSTRLCNREARLRRETEAAEVAASDSLFAAAVPSVGSSSPVRASFVDAWACAVSDEEEVGRQELEDEVFGQRSVFCDTPGFFARLDEEKRMLLLRYPAAVSDSDSDDSWV